jgi:hypothetical protein
VGLLFVSTAGAWRLDALLNDLKGLWNDHICCWPLSPPGCVVYLPVPVSESDSTVVLASTFNVLRGATSVHVRHTSLQQFGAVIVEPEKPEGCDGLILFGRDGIICNRNSPLRRR